jgi:hypothetical protein
MGKKRLIILGSFVFIFSAVNLYLYLNKGENSYTAISGMATRELPFGLNLSALLFILQWVILLLIVIFAYVRFLKHHKQEEIEPETYVIPTTKDKSKTDLDALYDLLKTKRSLSTGAISKIFGVSKEKALEWGTVLESSELVTIEYPAFNDPEIRLKETEEEIMLKEKSAKQKNDETGKKK